MFKSSVKLSNTFIKPINLFNPLNGFLKPINLFKPPNGFLKQINTYTSLNIRKPNKDIKFRSHKFHSNNDSKNYYQKFTKGEKIYFFGYVTTFLLSNYVFIIKNNNNICFRQAIIIEFFIIPGSVIWPAIVILFSTTGFFWLLHEQYNKISKNNIN